MIRICLTFLGLVFYTTFLQAEELKFKFVFGSNLGAFPFEINKQSQKTKKPTGIKINSWVLSPKFSSVVRDKKLSDFSENTFSKDKIYIKFNFKF
ncbi:hypothetical protein OAA95_00590 [Pelagibacteraceae bacterium]|nr:hypothetical protein [Pelagibacteraceae bacterium]